MAKPTRELLLKTFEEEIRKVEEIGPAPSGASYYEFWVELDKIIGPELEGKLYRVIFEYTLVQETVAGSSLGYYHCASKELEVLIDESGKVVGSPEMKLAHEYTRMYEEKVSPLLEVR